MNHYAARKMEGTEHWHYTCHNRRQGTWPVGYCGNECPGHATAAEACEHYKQYLLDRTSFRGPKLTEWPKHKCRVATCNKEATYMADVPLPGILYFELCREHANREAIAELLIVSESYSS